MSTRILCPRRLMQFRSPRTTIRSRRHMPSIRALARVKRDLFGPVDQEETREFVKNELDNQIKKSSLKWSFDFVRGKPICGSNSNYVWEQIADEKIDAFAYTLTHSAHFVEKNDDESNLYDLLVDQRANKSNNEIVNTSSPNTSAELLIIDTELDESLIHPQSSSHIQQTSHKNVSIHRIQPKITDFLKERKRSATASSSNSSSSSKKDVPPTKKPRHTPSSLFSNNN